MFYSDLLPISDQTVITVKLTDFSSGMNTKLDTNVMPLNLARNTYNFNFSTGALTTGMGFQDLTLPDPYGDIKTMEVPTNVTDIKKLWVYKRWVDVTQTFSPLLLFYSEASGDGGNDEIYWGRVESPNTEFTSLININFTSCPVGINLRTDGSDKFFFCPTNSTDSLTTWDSLTSPEEWPTAPVITSLAYHANRLFATIGGDKSQIWFSSDVDPTNWIVNAFDGGYIEMTDERGTLNSVISYNNYLYIIREFGITRLSGSGDQSEFVVRHLALSSSQIFANTAVLCGDVVVMLCRDGIYQFDGLEMTKLTLGFENLFKEMDNSYACAAFLDGKYYLACKMDTKDYRFLDDTTNMTNNCLIELDLETGEYSILRGVDICALTTIQYKNISKLVACFGSTYKNRLGELTYNGKVFGTPTQKVWESPYTDMGYPSRNKIIKSITMLNKHDSQIGVFVDGKTHIFDVPASENKAVKVPINLRGNTFAIAFYSTENDAYISNPQMEVNLE